MKFGIVTYHFVNNYGAALQTYALSQTITKLNDNEETKIVDYRHWFIRFTDFVRMFPITSNIKEIGTGITTFNQRVGRVKKFDKFHNEEFNLTERYNTKGKLSKYPPNCDKFICGSDQIWNPILTMGVASPYYLGFAKNKEQKVSYAASFGISQVKGKHQKKMKKHFQDFKAISVREKEGVKLVDDIAGVEATQLIDPTFLLSKEEWSQLAIKPKFEEPYILIYIMQKNDSVYDYARKIKQALGIKVVAISRYGYKPDFVDEVCIDVGPKEFLGLFENATFVCTNSFHGLAFSLIFEKQFCVIPSTRFNSRIQNLIDLFEIKQVNEITKENLEGELYSKEKAKSVMENEKMKATTFLNKNLLDSSWRNK